MEMKKLLLILALACGGADRTEVVDFGTPTPQPSNGPGVDLSHDIIGPGNVLLPPAEPEDAPDFAGFESQEEFDAYCVENPEYLPCNELGQLGQPWTSHQYHGFGHEPRACFSTWSSASVGHCYFPASKAIRLRSGLFNAGPFDDWAAYQVAVMTSWERWWVEQALLLAIRDFHNAAGITVSDTSGAQTLWYTYSRANPDGGFGSGGVVAGLNTRVNNAPLAPNGEDEGALATGSVGHIQINPIAALTFLENECWARTEAGITTFIYNLTVHEFLHSMGFAHFQTGIMKPYHGCEWAYSYFPLPDGFRNALAAFNPSSSGVSIQTDSGRLNSEGP
jgi:hypothetical protein